jgi:hypothetical protein
VRLRSGTGASLREWPIKEGCCFSVGNSVFHCTRQQPPAAVDTAADASAAATTAAGSTASDNRPAQDVGGARYVLLLQVFFARKNCTVLNDTVSTYGLDHCSTHGDK